jgi:solute carrier family 25 (mitochondrial phosphate transporter), member 23/24/25/41
VRGAKAIMSAIARIYAEGGIAAFWVGNGLSVAKIFPESAIKFLTYEASVRPVSSPFVGFEHAP